MRWEDRIGHRLKLRDLHILLAVAQCRSMSRAADQLAISHPVVSKAISDLEKTLGLRLFDRTPQGSVPTPYGSALLRCGTVVFDELRQSTQEIAFLADPTVGELRVGSAHPYIEGLMPAAISGLAKRYPKIKFQITDTDAVTLCGMLRERRLDIVIGRVLSSVFGDDLSADYLFDDTLHVVAGASSRWAKRATINLEELSREPWLMPQSDNIAMALIVDMFASAGLMPPTPQVVSNSMTLRMRLVESGRFIAILPNSTLHFGRKRMRVKILPIPLRMQAPPIQAIFLRNRTPNPIARLFIEELRGIAKPLLERQDRSARKRGHAAK
jgi:DNA-binding transcriptional LysR family regulator